MTSFQSKVIFVLGLLFVSNSSFAWTYESEQCDSDKLHSLYVGNMVHGQQMLSRKDNDDGIRGIEMDRVSDYTAAQVDAADYFYSIVEETQVGKTDEQTSECFTIRMMQYTHTMVIEKVKPEITAFLGIQTGDRINFTCKLRESTHLQNCQLTKPPKK